jgi:hypothetical protein
MTNKTNKQPSFKDRYVLSAKRNVSGLFFKPEKTEKTSFSEIATECVFKTSIWLTLVFWEKMVKIHCRKETNNFLNFYLSILLYCWLPTGT